MATRRQAAKAATREKVLSAAAACFAGGYERATSRDIASLAGMSTGAVFANFTGKEHLYREVVGHDPISPELGHEMRTILEACARQFREYERHHRAKPDREKAERNAALAELAEGVLAKMKGVVA